ncbi:MAG: hypothetical protein C0597_00405 [Marinilabiliales bacterium]|nr:MAG: hypothetical protein C0597_00405 [Marinilabiliales bacterium]
MKKNVLKRIFNLSWLIVAALLTFTACSDDDDDNGDPDEILLEGMYISGTATGGETLKIDADQIIEPGSDFTIKETRSGMKYQIHYLVAGDVMFKEVVGTTQVEYGVSNVADSTQTMETGEPFDYQRGELVADGTTAFTVAQAGLYYIITDKTTMNFWIMKINNFEISATGDKATFVSGDATGATFVAEGVDIRAAFKLRMNTGWKIIANDVAYDGTSVDVEDHVRMVTSYGGSIAVMTPDGDDITVDNGGKLLDFTFTWTPGSRGIAGFVGTTVQGDDLPPLAFPTEMYIIGASIGGWSWDTDAIQMIPVHSNPHLFWKNVWIESGVTDAGFKFCEEKAWGKDFGVDADAGATDGVYAKGTQNVPDVDESGSYLVVINLEENTVEVNPAKVYGMGPVFGDDAWAGTTEFTVDNVAGTVYSPAFTASDNLRMYFKAATLTNADGDPVDWWQAEFNVYDGAIVYRGTGNDQDAVAVTAGQVVTLDFSDDTGTIQ